jgi:Na+/proline symporter
MAFFIGAGLTMMLGSIPQQDVFQRVMSAKGRRHRSQRRRDRRRLLHPVRLRAHVHRRQRGGGDGRQRPGLAKNDYQRVLPTFVLTKMPLVMQILFFGALLSAIKSTSSATLLAPSTSFVENILKNLRPRMSDKQQLFAMRATIVCFTGPGAGVCDRDEGHVDLRPRSPRLPGDPGGAFVPLVMGLYWKRSTTQGAIFSVAAGLAAWILFFPQVGGEALSKAFRRSWPA